MVELEHASRGLQDIPRDYYRTNSGYDFKLNPWPWPFKGAVSFTFDCEGTYGGGESFRGETEVVPQLCEIFEEYKLQATFNFVGKIVEEYEDILKIVRNKVQDIAGHGYSHCYLDELSTSEQTSEIEKTTNAIKDAIGIDIIGWRSPYGIYTEATYDILTRKNFEWASNWSSFLWGKLPFTPIINGKLFNLVEIPFDDAHFDWFLYKVAKAKPNQAMKLWFNHILQSRRENSLYVLLNHPVNLADDAEKVHIIECLVKNSLNLRDVWIGSCEQISKRAQIFSNLRIRQIEFRRKQGKYIIKCILENDNKMVVDDASLIISGLEEIASVQDVDESMYTIDRSRPEPKLLMKIPKILPRESIEFSFSIS